MGEKPKTVNELLETGNNALCDAFTICDPNQEEIESLLTDRRHILIMNLRAAVMTTFREMRELNKTRR